jgi:membrane-associated phospholipid phosphatase
MAATGTRVITDERLQPNNQALVVLSFAWVVLATIALAALAFAAHTTPYFSVDLTIAHAVQSIHAQWFDILMRAIDFPGFPPQVYVEIGLILLFLFLTHRRWEAFSVVFASVGIGAAGLLIKVLVDRHRPSPELIHVNNPALDGGKFSFTAGHVESYIAIFGFLWFLAYMSQNRSVGRTLVLVILGALIALIGLSRVYSGEHWFSDIVGAYLLGSTWLILTIHVYEWGKTRFPVEGRSRANKPN